MATKSKELLSKPAQIAAARLRKLGWRQKDYLSAGVIAIEQATAAERERFRAMAAEASVDPAKPGSLDESIAYIKKLALTEAGYETDIKFLNKAGRAVLAELRKVLGPDSGKSKKAKKTHKTG